MIENVLLVGVGGQGIILAADVLARALVQVGYDVKLSEVHGMSQRGGSVHTAVRFGDKVYSPLVEKGEADHLLALERLEGARWAPYCRRGGRMILSNERIKPLPVLIGTAEYPAEPFDAVKGVDVEIIDVPAVDLASEAGTTRSANIVLLGVLARGLPVEADTWREVIASRVPPKTVENNLRAFDIGFEWQDIEKPTVGSKT